MCGILGVFSANKNSIRSSTIESALGIMKTRGPNDQGIEFISDSVGDLWLGHTRLSIIDLSDSGHQPMFSYDKAFVIVFNGEIYNYKELRHELLMLGWVFKSDSDTEVLLTAWQQWGKSCLSRLIGMFSFVIFDRRNRTLFCVRDGFGIKPFFYFTDSNQFLFASDIRALRAVKSSKSTINWQRAYDYLVKGDYDHNDHTFISGVKHLMPGHMLTITLGAHFISEPECWWTPPSDIRDDLTMEQAIEMVRSQFLENVRLHLRSDVPIGVALSGGIDSSAIACAIRYLNPEMAINTFSYIAQDAHLSEEYWINRVNKEIGANEHKIVVSEHELIQDLDALIEAQGEPFGSTSCYAQYKIFQLVQSSNVLVTLDGQGADELLAGYHGYPSFYLQSLFEKKEFVRAFQFLNEWRKWPRRGNSRALYALIKAVLGENAGKYIKNRLTPSWLNLEFFKDREVVFGYNDIFQSKEYKGRRVIEALINDLQQRSIPQLLRHADRNSMLFSVESRVPFLTVPFANFLMSLPEAYLISGEGETKHIFRKAMRGIVPDDVLSRRDKIGFFTPEQLWFEKNLEFIRSCITFGETLPCFHYKELLHEFDTVMARKKPFSWQLWRWINFIKWAETLT